MMKRMKFLCFVAIGSLCLFGACGDLSDQPAIEMIDVFVTSEAGAKIESVNPFEFRPGVASGLVVEVKPDQIRQELYGIGSSFTESSAFVLAHLEPDRRREVMRDIYGEAGANFSLTRTHIGSCDFSVEGKYSYADIDGDVALNSFTIEPDVEGFDTERHPGVQTADYDLLPMIQEALEIKGEQDDSALRIVASAWTAPPWMKDTGRWYIPGSEENGWQGDGGRLKSTHLSTYADYLVKYLDAYRDAGVDIWALTPVNEPHGNGGQWESMHFSPESQNEFIKNHLGPRLAARDATTELLIYDQNRDGLEEWTDTILGDPETAPYVYGAAVHWYSSTYKVFEETFDRVLEKFPDCRIIHSEGCIDNLGVEAPSGIEDPEGYTESDWFANDSFWWNANASDWAYSASWAGPAAADHPIYTPVHRYARNIIVSLNHGLSGWIDWNVVLDREGGPNHVGNFCGAPIMIDTETGEIYYTPIYYVLAQFSRTIRPGDYSVVTEISGGDSVADSFYASASLNGEGLLSVQLLNTRKEPLEFSLQIGTQYSTVTIPANAVQTLRVQL